MRNGSARRTGAELRRTQTGTDQRLDELASQIEMQKSKHDELMTAMRMTTDQRLDQMALQMQDMLTTIGRLVNSKIPAPHRENLPGQEPTQKPSQPTGTDSNENRQINASHGGDRLGCFECSQLGQFAKECPRKASVHLNYRGLEATSELKGSFVPADVQRQQVPKRDQLIYDSYRRSYNEWPKRDAVKDSKTLRE